MSFASIVPLIGGETIAMQNVSGKKPEYILSYSAFEANDNQLVEYYDNKVPYYHLDGNMPKSLPTVESVNTVCPCAGLSSLSPVAGTNNSNNDWMTKTAKHVLEHINPKVFWGENAPRLASKMGQPIVKNLRKIGQDNGYTFSIYKTKSILHGLSQVRDRTFYFFWKGDRVPLFEYINKKPSMIADDIRAIKRDPNDPMDILTNDKIPSEEPYYKYILEELEGGITHAEFVAKLTKSTGLQDYIEERTNYKVVAKWMREKGYDTVAKKCDRQYHKLKAGGNIMRKGIEIPKDKIGAFVGHMPTNLTHPDEDRFLTVREALSIMKLPSDFELLNPKRSLNHICQNVPVTTAEHPAEMVKKYLEGRLDLIDTDFMVQDNKKKTYEYEKSPLQLDQFML